MPHKDQREKKGGDICDGNGNQCTGQSKPPGQKKRQRNQDNRLPDNRQSQGFEGLSNTLDVGRQDI